MIYIQTYLEYLSNLGACAEKDMDYNGYDIGKVMQIKTWMDCNTECKNHAKCAFWSWSSTGLICLLKTSDIGRISVQGRISGKKGCKGKYILSTIEFICSQFQRGGWVEIGECVSGITFVQNLRNLYN